MRQQLDDDVEQLGDAGAGLRGDEADRDQVAFAQRLLERRVQLGGVDVAVVEVAVDEVGVDLDDLLDERPVRRVDAAEVAVALAVVEAVDDLACRRASGRFSGRHSLPNALLDLRQHAGQVDAGRVDPVDDDHAVALARRGVLHHAHRHRLDADRRVDDDRRRLDRLERGQALAEEIGRARRVDEVDARLAARQVQHARVERVLHAPLERIEVADRRAALERSRRDDRARGDEQRLGEAGLAGGGRADERERADRFDTGARAATRGLACGVSFSGGRRERPAVVKAEQEALAGGELGERHVFVGLVRLGDVARAADDGRRAGALEQARLGAERDQRRRVGGGEALREQHGRIVGAGEERRHLADRLEADAGVGVDGAHRRLERLGIGADLALHRRHVAAGQVPELVVEAAVGGDDVVGDAAFDDADRAGAVGHVEALVARLLVAPARRHVGELGDDARADLDRVDRLRRQRRMRGVAAHAAAPAVDALVGERRDHAGRLADDAGERRDAGVAHVGDQPARAEAADLLVVAEREVDGERQVGGEERRHLGDGQADEALHVGAAAAVEAAVLDLRAERIDRPVLAVPRHGVGVAGDDHAGRLARAERREQVRLPPLVVEGQPARDAVAGQLVADELDQREVRFPADGVDADERARHLERARGGSGGHVHRCNIATAPLPPRDGPRHRPRRHRSGLATHRLRHPPHAAPAHRRRPARHRRRRALAQARAPAGRRQLQGARHVQPDALERRFRRPASSSPRAATPASRSPARRRRSRVRCEVFVPESSSRAKRDKLAALGAVVNVVGASYGDALAASLARQAESGALLMHAYDQREVVIGAATLAAEVEADAGVPDRALVSVGGGGLIAGVCAWFGGALRDRRARARAGADPAPSARGGPAGRRRGVGNRRRFARRAPHRRDRVAR